MQTSHPRLLLYTKIDMKQLCVYLLLMSVFTSAATSISYDNRSVILNGERVLMLSGSIHYTRILPEEWEQVIILAKEMGLNTIQTYVMWNFHEQEKGNWRWDYRRDLRHFLSLIHKHGLYANVRIGPYVCGEYYFGGVPIWMREEAKCYRCSDPGWEKNMADVLSLVVNELKTDLLYPEGPVVMFQVENEYNGGDETYLKWAVETARNLTTDVPWILCHDQKSCAALNVDSTGAPADNVICTINGFWMDEKTKYVGQPSPVWMAYGLEHNPTMPLIWTEDQGWFNQWKVAKRVRVSSDQLYGIARFLAYGGSWHNFYMVTGGNNYGYQAGGEVTTAYAQDTAINYLLRPHQPRYGCYQKFFSVLNSVASELLSNPIPVAVPLLPNELAKSSVDLTAVACTDEDPAHVGSLDESQQWEWKAVSAQKLLSSVFVKGHCLGAANSTLVPCNETDPSQILDFTSDGRIMTHYQQAGVYKCLTAGSGGVAFAECVSGNDTTTWTYDSKEKGLREKDSAKICMTVAVSTDGSEAHSYGNLTFLSNMGPTTSSVVFNGKQYTLANHSVSIVLNGDVLYATNDCTDVPHVPTAAVQRSTTWKSFTEDQGYGAKTSVSKTPTEQLSITDNNSDYLWYSFPFTANTSAADVAAKAIDGSIAYTFKNTTHINILSCAMGVVNGGLKPTLGKGISGVTVDGKAYEPAEWTQSSMLRGEELSVFNRSGSTGVSWTDYKTPGHDVPITWYQSEFPNMPGGLSYALNLTSMWKGVAYVNGFNIGRFWLTPGLCDSSCAPPVKNGHCYMHWDDCGKPTQTIYHIPLSVMNTTGTNLVTLFSEGDVTKEINLFDVSIVSYTED